MCAWPTTTPLTSPRPPSGRRLPSTTPRSPTCICARSSPTTPGGPTRSPRPRPTSSSTTRNTGSRATPCRCSPHWLGARACPSAPRRCSPGVHINTSEDRAVLHTALRAPRELALAVDGQDVPTDVHRRARPHGRVHRRRSLGRVDGRTPASGSRAVVNIGIGGSDLGPGHGLRGAARTTRPRPDDALRLQHRPDRHLPRRCATSTRPTTLFIDLVQDLHHPGDADQRRAPPAHWLLDGLGGEEKAVAKHFVAVSTNAKEVTRVRHRRGQHVRLLGLGGRALLGRLRHRPLAHGGDRQGAVRRVPRRHERHRPALPHRAARGEPAGHPGPAQRLVRQPLRRADPRRAALQPVPAPRFPPTCSS